MTALLQLSAGFAHVTGIEFQWDGELDLLRGLLLILALGTMIGSIFLKRHMMAALVLGVAGYSVGGLFLLEPAPDVALVQFMVETLGTVLIIIMLSKINAPQREAAMNDLWKQSRFTLYRDIALSAMIGVGVALFCVAAINNRAIAQTIATWHLENAVPLLGFSDVVGAIVTDFRGMDTIIEITVFSVAALGVLTLLAKPSPGGVIPKRISIPRPSPRLRIFQLGAAPDEPVDVQHAQEAEGEDLDFESHFSTPLTRTIAQLVLPFALIVSMSQSVLWWRSARRWLHRRRDQRAGGDPVVRGLRLPRVATASGLAQAALPDRCRADPCHRERRVPDAVGLGVCGACQL